MPIKITDKTFNPDSPILDVAAIIDADPQQYIPAKIRDHGGADQRKNRKAALFARDKFRCVYCGQFWRQPDIEGKTQIAELDGEIVKAKSNGDGSFPLNIDHIICRRTVAIMEEAGIVDSKFLNSYQNMITTCATCNTKRGIMNAHTFIASDEWSAANDSWTRFLATEKLQKVILMSSTDKKRVDILKTMIGRVVNRTSPGKKLWSGSQNQFNMNQRTLLNRLIAKAFMNRHNDGGTLRMSAGEKIKFDGFHQILKKGKMTVSISESIEGHFSKAIASLIYKNEMSSSKGEE